MKPGKKKTNAPRGGGGKEKIEKADSGKKKNGK